MKLTNKIYDKGCGVFEKGMLIIPTEILNSYGIIYIYFTFFVGDKNMCLGVTKSILKHGFMIQIHVNSFSNLYGIFDQTNSFYIHIIMKFTT